MDLPENRVAPAEEIETWIEAARQGNQNALGHLLEWCRPYLLQIANDQVSPDLQARCAPSDLVQDACLQAQVGFGGFHGTREAELLAWLRTILLNRLRNVVRHAQAAGRAREVAFPSPDSSPTPPFLADSRLTPSKQIMARESDEALHRALVQLPPDYRQGLHLRQWEELSFEEIGQRLNRSAEAARKLWARAVEALSALLESPDESPRSESR
jgi:RNA polymerase sigma-70 factor (ECF subfamily)